MDEERIDLGYAEQGDDSDEGEYRHFNFIPRNTISICLSS